MGRTRRRRRPDGHRPVLLRRPRRLQGHLTRKSTPSCNAAESRNGLVHGQAGHVVVWVWVGIGLFLVACLAVSWSLDHAARKRGATPRSGAEISRARWKQERDAAREMSQVNRAGMLPRLHDAARDMWRGKTDRDR